LATPSQRNRAAAVTAYLLFLVALWGVSGYWAFTERAVTLAAADRQLSQITTAVAEQTLGWLRLLKLSLIGADHWITVNPGVDPATSRDFKHLAEATRNISGGLVDMRMVTRTGGLRYIGAKDSAPLADVTDREYFRAQQNPDTRGFFIALPVQSRVTGKWGIPISYPVSDPASRTGVLFGALEFDRIAPLHEQERLKPGGSIALIRTDGRFISRVPFDEAYMTKTVAGSSNFLGPMLTGGEGVLHSDGSQVDGVARLIGYARLPGYPLVVVVTALPDEILAPWRRQCLTIAGFMLAISALGGALLLRLWAALKLNEQAQAVLELQASTDGLTGLLNRRAYLDAARRELGRARRSGRGLTLLMLDLDHFKEVNDGLGHAAGDAALHLLGQVLPQMLRVNDLAGRVGGEEFCVLLPEVAGARAVEVAERLRREFAEASEKLPCLSRRVTLSVGLAELDSRDESLEALLLRADQALYRAKAGGRDRVEVALA